MGVALYESTIIFAGPNDIIGMLVVTFAIDWIPFQIPIQDHLLAALASGACIGAGAGIYLHSLGSVGGTDVIAIILNKIWNVRIGQFFSISIFFFSV
ncbi:MAG: YitT family protein [Thermodesulfobacteriota bacterium]|nr:YitT family protein [Thermodesulfobacteriota bacterium]